MREWRKLYRGIRESSRLRKCGMEARWLYILLLSSQDDLGRYQWDDAKVALLVSATTTWTNERAGQLAVELERVGLVEIHTEHVLLTGAAEKNGVPNYAGHRGAKLYDITCPISVCNSVNTRINSLNTRMSLEKSRGEERREEPDQSRSGLVLDLLSSYLSDLQISVSDERVRDFVVVRPALTGADVEAAARECSLANVLTWPYMAKILDRLSKKESSSAPA